MKRGIIRNTKKNKMRVYRMHCIKADRSWLGIERREERRGSLKLKRHKEKGSRI